MDDRLVKHSLPSLPSSGRLTARSGPTSFVIRWKARSPRDVSPHEDRIGYGLLALAGTILISHFVGLIPDHWFGWVLLLMMVLLFFAGIGLLVWSASGSDVASSLVYDGSKLKINDHEYIYIIPAKDVGDVRMAFGKRGVPPVDPTVVSAWPKDCEPSGLVLVTKAGPVRFFSDWSRDELLWLLAVLLGTDLVSRRKRARPSYGRIWPGEILDSTRTNSRRLRLFLILIILVCAGILWDHLPRTVQGLRSSSWSPTTGVVEVARVTPPADPDEEDPTGEVIYRYQVQGRSYQGSRIAFTPLDSEQDLIPFVNMHRPGDSVLVYYDPSRPEQAVLRPGAPTGEVIGTLILMGILLFCGWMWRREPPGQLSVIKAYRVRDPPLQPSG